MVRLAAVLGPHADARVTRAVHGYRWAVPAVRGAAQAVQWLDEQDAVRGLLQAGRALTAAGERAGRPDVAGEVVNLATADWLSADDVAGIAGGHVLALPRRALVLASELSRRAHLTPFGADRASLIGGPLALSIEKAGRLLGWEPRRTSGEVLGAALRQDWQQLPRNRRR